ncbi:MAG: hypothetical protein ACTS77_03625 [Arsenophonus sp. NC-TX2-MAG3]
MIYRQGAFLGSLLQHRFELRLNSGAYQLPGTIIDKLIQEKRSPGDIALRE